MALPPPVRALLRRTPRLRTTGLKLRTAYRVYAGAIPAIDDYRFRLRPRWGYGAPGNAALLALIEANRTVYTDRLRSFLPFVPLLQSIPMHAPMDQSSPRWEQTWFPPLDALALYCMISSSRPARFLEIGSGESTRFARRAIEDHALSTELISIDPRPRAEIDGLCDRAIRMSVEDMDPAEFDVLEPGDVLFIDGSHRASMNSDVAMLWFDVLPRLRSGVVIHLHDVFLPYDYPPGWGTRLYSEQYVLAASLLAGQEEYPVLFPSWYITRDTSLLAELEPAFEEIGIPPAARYGASFWFQLARDTEATRSRSSSEGPPVPQSQRP